MKHINLLWPFVTQNHFEETIKLLLANKSFQALKPFQVRMERFAFNDNSKYPLILFYFLFIYMTQTSIYLLFPM